MQSLWLGLDFEGVGLRTRVEWFALRHSPNGHVKLQKGCVRCEMVYPQTETETLERDGTHPKPKPKPRKLKEWYTPQTDTETPKAQALAPE